MAAPFNVRNERRRVTRYALLGSGAAGGGGDSPLDPATLSPTLWLDASDITTLFQDLAGATPVTASGQSVRKFNDLSGNARHFTNGSTTQPAYEESGGLKYLIGNGKVMNGPAISNIIGAGSYEFVIALRFIDAPGPVANSWSAPSVLADNLDYFNIHIVQGPQIGHYAWQTSDQRVRLNYVLASDVVVNARSDGTNIYLSLNGGAESSAASTGPSNRTGLARLLGAAATNLRFYAMLAFNKNLSASERASAITWAGVRAGLTL